MGFSYNKGPRADHEPEKVGTIRKNERIDGIAMEMGAGRWRALMGDDGRRLRFPLARNGYALRLGSDSRPDICSREVNRIL